MVAKERYTQLVGVLKGKVLPFAILSVVAVSALSKDDKLDLPYGEKDTDQSFQIGAGWHENGGSGEAFQLSYRHPLWQHVKLNISMNRAKIRKDIDRTEFLMGLQIHPWKNNVYAVMGGGASKTAGSEEAIFSSALGYEWDLPRNYYVDTHASGEWTFDGTARWSSIIAIGKRF